MIESTPVFRRYRLNRLATQARRACLVITTALVAWLPCPPVAASNGKALESNPAALARFISESPDKLAIVLISTPGCGFCKLVRERELQPLLRNEPQFAGHVEVFEILLRDTTRFEPPIAQLRTRQHGVLNNVGSPAELSAALNLNLAPVVMFIGRHTELGEPMIGYSEHFYGSYLEENIRRALTQLQ